MRIEVFRDRWEIGTSWPSLIEIFGMTKYKLQQVARKEGFPHPKPRPLIYKAVIAREGSTVKSGRPIAKHPYAMPVDKPVQRVDWEGWAEEDLYVDIINDLRILTKFRQKAIDKVYEQRLKYIKEYNKGDDTEPRVAGVPVPRPVPLIPNLTDTFEEIMFIVFQNRKSVLKKFVLRPPGFRVSDNLEVRADFVKLYNRRELSDILQFAYDGFRAVDYKYGKVRIAEAMKEKHKEEKEKNVY